jgi:probable O-glycosylation ligase (exosortase A-associated)
MRELLLMAMLAPVCGMSIVNARIGVLAYIAFVLGRPDSLAYSTKPLFFVLTICIFIGALRIVGDVRYLFRSGIILALLLLQIPIAMSVLSAVDESLCFPQYTQHLKEIAMCLSIPIAFASDERWLRPLFLTISFSLGVIAVKFAAWGLLTGGIVTTGVGGMIGDTNGLGLAMVMMIPISWYSTQIVSHKLVKYALYGITLSGLVTLVLTSSRGNSISFCIVALLIIARSKRKATTLAVLVVLAIPILLVVGDRYLSRMEMLQQHDESAVSRLEFAGAAVRMWADHPVFGVGYGMENYVRLSSIYLGRPNPNNLVVHDTYLQTLVDEGIIAFVMYISLLFGSIFILQRSLKRIALVRPDLLPYGRGLQASIIGFAISSTAYSRCDFEFFFIVLASAGAAHVIFKGICSNAITPAVVVLPENQFADKFVRSRGPQIGATTPKLLS